MHDPQDFDAIIIGGGFYGARLGLMLRRAGHRVLVVEREPVLLGRASLRNQARVHNGYHYPRSILTSLRSRVNYARFRGEYADCVDESFTHYYAIARGMSKVTGAQFAEFCRRIAAPLEPAPDPVRRLFEPSRIDAVFTVRECAFDAVKLRRRMERDLRDAGVDVRLGTDAVGIMAGTPTRVRLARTEHHDGEPPEEVVAPLVINATYAGLNDVLRTAGASGIPMKHELTELALVEPPAELAGAAVTVMDGPFFSLMPYPSRGLFTLSHVRYTPHCSWTDGASPPLTHRASRFAHMQHDAARYLPCMRGARHVDSLWEIKAIMPRSEHDDSRPILFRRSAEVPGLVSVLGAKIDSVYDVEDALAAALQGERAERDGRPAA